MEEDLPLIVFETKSSEQIDQEEKGALAYFDPRINTVVTPERVNYHILIHELDHFLSSKRRIESWSSPIVAKCPDGNQVTIPKLPYLPGREEAQTQFTFSLDFTKNTHRTFLYDNYQLLERGFRTLEAGKEACLTEENIKAKLASEVHAYLTEARYLCLVIGLSYEDLQEIHARGRESNAYYTMMEKTMSYFMKEPDIEYDNTLNLLDYYLGIGGRDRYGDLGNFARKVLVEKGIKGFINSPDCVPAP